MEVSDQMPDVRSKVGAIQKAGAIQSGCDPERQSRSVFEYLDNADFNDA
jgi:hypothetical protein